MLEEILRDFKSGMIPYIIGFIIYSLVLFLMGYVKRRQEETNNPRLPDDRDLNKIWECILVQRFYINREISSDQNLCIIMQDITDTKFKIVAFEKEITTKRTIENEERNFIIGELYELKFNDSTQDLIWKHITKQKYEKKISEISNYSNN